MKSRVIAFVLLISLLVLFRAAVVGSPDALAQESPPVLAFYYAWFDQNTWDSGQSADLPAERYRSAGRAVIERQVSQAQGAGIDAFVQSWYGPQEANNQTETNFRTLLDVAANRGFKAAVDLEVTGPFFGDAAAVTNALATLLVTHAQHPAYLRYRGKPVIFFWRQQRFSVDEWANIRNQVDPDHNTYWIAEGVDIAYQTVFDGHHLYSIAWAASPADELADWGNRVRAYEAEHQVDRLWVATAMPGYDDTRLPRDNAFAVPRRDGEYYRETWQAALASQPDMIIVTSFNEWLEGTHIEPSVNYGNLYLDITRELVTALRGHPPVAPAVVPAAQASPAAPLAEPYIKVENLTNVREGPAITFTKVGQLAAGRFAPVVGRVEAGDWWQIDFEGGPKGKGWVSAEVVEFIGNRENVPLAGDVAANNKEEAVPLEATAVATPTEPVMAGSIEALDPVNVRAEPSVEGARVGGLFPGESAGVLAISDDGDWWQIDFPDGPDGSGWVAIEFVRFTGNKAAVPIFGLGTPTPTPGPTDTPTATPIPPSPTSIQWPPPYAPTATSIYQATSAALLDARGTPDPSVTELPPERRSIKWGNLPWGILSVLAVVSFFWYRFSRRRRGKSRGFRSKW